MKLYNEYAIPGMPRYPKLPTVSGIIQDVNQVAGFDVTGKGKKAELVAARQVAMTIAHLFTTESLSAIGNYFKKDHATVFHAIKTVRNGRDSSYFHIKTVLDTVFTEYYSNFKRTEENMSLWNAEGRDQIARLRKRLEGCGKDFIDFYNPLNK